MIGRLAPSAPAGCSPLSILGTLTLLTAVAFGVTGPQAAIASEPPARLGASGTDLHPVRHPSTITLDPGAPCRLLVANASAQCGIVAAKTGTLLFTLTSGPLVDPVLVSRPWTVTVYRITGAFNAAQARLATQPTDGNPGPLFANVTARPADLTGDGQQSLVIGSRAEGTADVLSVDVIVGATGGPRVAAHLDLPKGSAVVLPGRLVTYAAAYLAKDANCCPSFVQRDELRLRGGSLRITRTTRIAIARADQPSGDLG